tara:strand:+ start:101 stop:364 length:264 start_codon:yes stop_codon:yes gene_type:complete
MLPRTEDIDSCRSRLNVWIAHDNHYIRVVGELVNERTKQTVLDLHPLELSLGLPAAQFELLNNIADLLEPVCVEIRLGVVVARVADD